MSCLAPKVLKISQTRVSTIAIVISNTGLVTGEGMPHENFGRYGRSLNFY